MLFYVFKTLTGLCVSLLWFLHLCISDWRSSHFLAFCSSEPEQPHGRWWVDKPGTLVGTRGRHRPQRRSTSAQPSIVGAGNVSCCSLSAHEVIPSFCIRSCFPFSLAASGVINPWIVVATRLSETFLESHAASLQTSADRKIITFLICF